MNSAPFQWHIPSPPTRTLRLGLIGLGWVTKYCHLPALRMLRAAGWPIEVVALCDLMPDRLQEAAAAWPEAAVGNDPVALLDRADLDGVLILTHPNSSARLLEQAIERGRTIFVEKPVAHTYAEIRHCAELAEKRSVKVQVGYNRRHQPLAVEFARLLHGLGPQRHLHARFWRPARQEPGFYDDTLVHCLDFISQQLGKLQVKGVRVWPPAGPAGLDSGWRIDLVSRHDPLVTAEIDIRPAVGRDIEMYTALGRKQSVSLESPHVSVADAQAALIVHDDGQEKVIYRARMAGDEIESMCRLSGFLRQMAEFGQLCAGTLAAPGCGLDAAMEALQLRDAIATLVSKDTAGYPLDRGLASRPHTPP